MPEPMCECGKKADYRIEYEKLDFQRSRVNEPFCAECAYQLGLTNSSGKVTKYLGYGDQTRS